MWGGAEGIARPVKRDARADPPLCLPSPQEAAARAAFDEKKRREESDASEEALRLKVAEQAQAIVSLEGALERARGAAAPHERVAKLEERVRALEGARDGEVSAVLERAAEERRTAAEGERGALAAQQKAFEARMREVQAAMEAQASAAMRAA